MKNLSTPSLTRGYSAITTYTVEVRRGIGKKETIEKEHAWKNARPV